MTDMPKYYPEDIIKETLKRIDKGVAIHTLALWTKHPASLLLNPLYGFLKDIVNKGIQLYVQITVTGMGGMVIGDKIGGGWKIEPNAPAYGDALGTLPEIISLAGDARRIKIRIDPIVKVKDYCGKIYSNIGEFTKILEISNSFGAGNFSFSLLEDNMHDKVGRRFKNIGCEILHFNLPERTAFGELIQGLQIKHKVKIYACCVEGFDDSACINGNLLSASHAENEPADMGEPRRRPKCGCVKSIDLGGWPVKRCYTGCDYCYANPAFDFFV